MSFLVAATNETHPMLFSVKPYCRFLVVRYTEDAGTIQPKKTVGTSRPALFPPQAVHWRRKIKRYQSRGLHAREYHFGLTETGFLQELQRFEIVAGDTENLRRVEIDALSGARAQRCRAAFPRQATRRSSF